MTIKLTGESGGVYSYSATVYDAGSFTAIRDAYTPNQGGSYAGDTITGPDSGWLTGKAQYSFTAFRCPRQARTSAYPPM
jgi:hypothetical protein